MDYYQEQALPVRNEVASSHQAAIEAYAQPGTWLDAETRIAILNETRAATACQLCQDRKSALSPYAVSGVHGSVTKLPDNIVEVVHRVTTDSGRMTLSWFKDTLESGLSQQAYVEIIGLVSTSLIIDSFSKALGCELAEPPEPVAGEPSKESNPDVVDDGAWLPMLDVEQNPTELELPTSPNIFRAMGLVPGAIAHFFSVMRSQYSLTRYDISLSRSQVELIAARISSLNQCFY